MSDVVIFVEVKEAVSKLNEHGFSVDIDYEHFIIKREGLIKLKLTSAESLWAFYEGYMSGIVTE